MTEDERKALRARINERPLTDFISLEKSPKGERGHYICPLCGSGTGPNKTGALTLSTYDHRPQAKCFNPLCDLTTPDGKRHDTLGALRIIWNCTETEVFKRAGLVDPGPLKPTKKKNTEATQRTQPKPTDPQPAVTEPELDLTAYYRECMARLEDPEAASYLSARGISIETARKCGVGFDPQADPAGTHHPEPRIICPTSKSHYVGRAVKANSTYPKMNNKGGKPSTFNLKALHSNNKRVFVTEGFFDALSIIEAGAAAISLNSVNNAEFLIEHLKKQRTNATLVLCMDGDAAGQKGLEILENGFKRLNISYITADINNGHKDPNEALTADRSAFIATIESLDAARPDNVASYMDSFMFSDIESFKESRSRKTGFELLDKKANGIYSGLYVVGAISSLGKTTFCTQLADQMAAAGEDVLFFSLEQSRLELVTKSIARRTAQNDLLTAVDSLSIRRGYLPPQVLQAAKEYKEAVKNRLSIIEGNFACNISFIGDYVRKYIDETGAKPVVFVDYLQILQPEKDEKGRTQSTKETVDLTVTELKRLSREHGLTVFVISSLNRNSYLSPIDFESFKESGGIEYTADVVWGLQLQVMNDNLFLKDSKTIEKRKAIKQAKKADPRKIELVCIKNRYGISNYSCYFDYLPKYDYYQEIPEPKDLFGDMPIPKPKSRSKKRKGSDTDTDDFDVWERLDRL